MLLFQGTNYPVLISQAQTFQLVICTRYAGVGTKLTLVILQSCGGVPVELYWARVGGILRGCGESER